MQAFCRCEHVRGNGRTSVATAKKTSAKRSSKQTSKRPTKKVSPELPVANLSHLRLVFRGWYLRTLQVDTAGEYTKLRRTVEFFLLQAERKLTAVLWDRASEVVLEEALSYLVLRWGPKFRGPLELEIRVTDTHLKFALMAPADVILPRKAPPTGKRGEARQTAVERSLYIVRRLVDRVQVDPAGRQLVLLRLLRRFPRF